MYMFSRACGVAWFCFMFWADRACHSRLEGCTLVLIQDLSHNLGSVAATENQPAGLALGLLLHETVFCTSATNARSRPQSTALAGNQEHGSIAGNKVLITWGAAVLSTPHPRLGFAALAGKF